MDWGQCYIVTPLSLSPGGGKRWWLILSFHIFICYSERDQRDLVRPDQSLFPVQKPTTMTRSEYHGGNIVLGSYFASSASIYMHACYPEQSLLRENFEMYQLCMKMLQGLVQHKSKDSPGSGSSCSQCWQAPRQLRTTGHKSLHIWICECEGALELQHWLGCIISKRNSALSLRSSLIVLELSSTADPTLCHPFCHPPASTSKTTALTTTDSQNIAFMGNLLWNHCTLTSLSLQLSFLHFKTSLIHCWCAVQDSCWNGLLFLPPPSPFCNSRSSSRGTLVGSMARV